MGIKLVEVNLFRERLSRKKSTKKSSAWAWALPIGQSHTRVLTWKKHELYLKNWKIQFHKWNVIRIQKEAYNFFLGIDLKNSHPYMFLHDLCYTFCSKKAEWFRFKNGPAKYNINLSSHYHTTNKEFIN